MNVYIVMDKQIETLFDIIEYRYEPVHLKLDLTDFLKNMSSVLANIQVKMPEPEATDAKKEEGSEVRNPERVKQDGEESKVATNEVVKQEAEEITDGEETVLENPDKVESDIVKPGVENTVRENTDEVNPYGKESEVVNNPDVNKIDTNRVDDNTIQFSIYLKYNSNKFSYNITNFIDQNSNDANTYTFTYDINQNKINPEENNQLDIRTLFHNNILKFNYINITYKDDKITLQFERLLDSSELEKNQIYKMVANPNNKDKGSYNIFNEIGTYVAHDTPFLKFYNYHTKKEINISDSDNSILYKKLNK